MCERANASAATRYIFFQTPRIAESADESQFASVLLIENAQLKRLAGTRGPSLPRQLGKLPIFSWY